MNQNNEQINCGLPDGGFWVFGYGSLMWNPGFPFKEKENAALPGFRRSLCVWSWHHRGTKNSPGLVFGLDKVGGNEACHGCAYYVSAEYRIETLAYLHKRELLTDIYQAATLPILINGREELALAFTVDSKSAQYAGQLNANECAAVIANAKGRSGPNSEYVLETWRYLQGKNIQDNHLLEISGLLARL